MAYRHKNGKSHIGDLIKYNDECTMVRKYQDLFGLIMINY